jgi:hypothetical protein
MFDLEKLKKKIDCCKNPEVIITVVKLPTGALEVITNYQELQGKIDYILNAYDDNLCLKTCPQIKLMDCIIL